MFRLFLRSRLADLLAVLAVSTFLVIISTGCSAGRAGLFQSNAVMCEQHPVVVQRLPIDRLPADADPVTRSKAMRASIELLQGTVGELRLALAACAAALR